METILVNKENALLSVQKIIKLVSSGKKLEVREIKEHYNHEKIQKSLNRALKEYERWEFIFWWIVNMEIW